jgi:transcription elongation factor GreA-like protein
MSYILNSETTDNCRRCGEIDDFCDGNESEKLCKHCLDHCCEECFKELESPHEEWKRICKECDEDDPKERKQLKKNLNDRIKDILAELPYMTNSQIKNLNRELVNVRMNHTSC